MIKILTTVIYTDIIMILRYYLKSWVKTNKNKYDQWGGGLQPVCHPLRTSLLTYITRKNYT